MGTIAQLHVEGARRQESGLPDAQTHHDHSEGHPPEDPNGDDCFQAHPSLSLLCMTLGGVFFHVRSPLGGSVVDPDGENGPSKAYALIS